MSKKENPAIIKIKNNNAVDAERDENENTRNNSSEHSEPDDDYKIDKLFYRICSLCLMLGVNFYCKRSKRARCLSLIIVATLCSINIYFIGYVVLLTLKKPFETDRVATSIGLCTWVLQAMLSTLFLAYWQYTNQSCKILKLLYAANKGAGIHHYRKSLLVIMKIFYIVTVLCIFYHTVLIVSTILEVNIGYWDKDIKMIFGHHRLFLIVQLSSLYCKLCWGVAIFVYGLLIHSTNYEFKYYNEQVRSMECKYECQTDEALCNYILKLIKIHNRLTECVQRLDKMFNIYAFAMLATIIPITIFSLFMVFRKIPTASNWELLILSPLIIFCTFSFFALLNSPSRLHDTIHCTKSALCANSHIWFPYRPMVYQSALAFSCHLDQANLGISIWGFAVVSKPLVLTTLSVMTTCLALFLQESAHASRAYLPAQMTATSSTQPQRTKQSASGPFTKGMSDREELMP